MNNRRKLVIALGAGALTAPFGSFAQQSGKVRRLGYLSLGGPENFAFSLEPFKRGMRELGHVEGKSYLLEVRTADGKAELLPDLAAELVRLKLEVIVVSSTSGAQAVQRASITIPIVLGTAADPVGTGLVKSLARPGGNVTGLSNLSVDISSKHVELLRAAVPRLSRVAVVTNPSNVTTASMLKHVQAAAQASGIKILPVEARNFVDIDAAFSALKREHADALIVALDPLFLQRREQIAGLATKNRLPSLASTREFVVAGCLMSYGQNLSENFRRAATYVDKILMGAKPGELPIEQPTKFELVVNMKTAKALGIKIPSSILVQATAVIE